MPGFTADFALLLFDEFSGAPINDSGVRFFYKDEPLTPLRKPDGHYVFGQFPEDAPTLVVERPRYFPAEVTVEKLKLPRGNPVAPVRLLRQYDSSFRDCAWIGGQCPPGSTVLAVARATAFQVRAAKAGEAGNTITIFGGGNAGLVGKRFAPEKGNDTFIILRMISLNDYLTDALPEQGSGAKPFARAYLSQSGEDGQFHIPVDECPEGLPEKAVWYNAAKKKWTGCEAQNLALP